MARFYPSGQAASAEFAFHTWLSLYMEGYAEANEIMMGSGLMEEAATRTKKFHVSIPPLSIGDTVEEKDGNEWPASFIQGAEIQGETVKQGPKGLQFTEDDLEEDKIGLANANMKAMGRAVKLFTDKKAAAALEAGLTTLGWDNKTVFATDHPVDAVKGSGSQSNSFNLGLSGDNLLTLIANFPKLQAENKDPVFAGQELGFSLIVPPALQVDGEKIVDRTYVTDAVGTVTNTAYKRAKLLVLPQLTDTGRWYVGINNLARKPLLKVVFKAMRQIRLGPESDMWKKQQIMKVFHYEKSQYRLPDWRLLATSKA